MRLLNIGVHCFASLLLPLTVSATLATDDVKEKMCHEINGMHHVMAMKYAPNEWKEEHFGWNLEEIMKRSKQKVWDNPEITIKDFHQIIHQIFQSTRDYHVGVRFYSTEMSYLPISIKGANGHYFVVNVDEEEFDENCPLSIGDEIISIDNKPVTEYVKKREKELFGVSNATNTSLAESSLFFYYGGRGDITFPEGEVVLTLKTASQGKVYQLKTRWIYHPEFVSGYRALGKKETFVQKHPLLNQQMKVPTYERTQILYPQEKVSTPSHEIGARMSFIPDLGQVVWRSSDENPFHAYIFIDRKGKKCGYVRIPSYEGDEDYAKEFEEIIAKMQAETRALVIDQVNNPGGSALYLYALASMLTNRPLEVPLHKMAMTQQEVWDAIWFQFMLAKVTNEEEAKELFGETLDGYPITLKLILQLTGFTNFVLSEYNDGKRMTDYCALEGIMDIEPHPSVRYTKPILFLINELDFSGGDFMPAILQDNKRATLMGTRTAGAGGAVNLFPIASKFGIAFYTATTTFAMRPTGDPIENLGIKPDIEYRITENDLKNRYQDYKQAILKALGNL